jgi:hypothetical protein
LGYFLIKQIYYIFTSISSFKTWFVVGILGFQKWSYVVVLGFQIELCCRYFGLFCLGDFLSYFLKNWAIFFQIFGSPCQPTKSKLELAKLTFFLFLELEFSRQEADVVQGSYSGMLQPYVLEYSSLSDTSIFVKYL